eukprot:355635-Chlamydomonas_euryale.AAC.7
MLLRLGRGERAARASASFPGYYFYAGHLSASPGRFLGQAVARGGRRRGGLSEGRAIRVRSRPFEALHRDHVSSHLPCPNGRPVGPDKV